MIRTGLKFAGTEKITIGGGEGLWLYIDKVLVVEFVSKGTGTDNCYKIDLSPAAQAGKFYVNPIPLYNGVHTNFRVSYSVHVIIRVNV